ncbi:MAG: CPBP family intramembrane metalloprotease, partial [Bacteroidetes bacterium]
MTREEQLRYCKICVHQQPDMRQGLLCGLTGQFADFEESCESFTEDPVLKEKVQAQQTLMLVEKAMADRGLRFANLLLDGLAFLLFTLTSGMVLGIFLAFFWFEGIQKMEQWGPGLNFLVSVLSGIIFYTLFETITGRTPGKYITGTRVVNLDGTKPGFVTILVRSMVRFIPLEPFSFLGAQPTGWHDRVSRTVVIKHGALPVVNPPQGYYPGVGQSFALTGLLLILMVASTPVLLLFGFLSAGFGFMVYYMVVFGVALLVGYQWRKKHTGQKSFPLNYRYMVYLPVVAVSAVSLHVGLVAPLIGSIPVPEALLSFILDNTFHLTLFSFITVVLLAPLLEEFLFRGIIQEGLIQRRGPVIAILLSSLLFGFMHLNPWQFVTAFLLGIIIGWLYYLTRDLVFAIGFHLFNNLFVVLVEHFQSATPAEGYVSTVLNAFAGTPLYYVLVIVNLILFAL